MAMQPTPRATQTDGSNDSTDDNQPGPETPSDGSETPAEAWEVDRAVAAHDGTEAALIASQRVLSAAINRGDSR